MPSFLVEMRGMRGLSYFLSGLASNHNPPAFWLLRSWDYRQGPPCPTLSFCLVLASNQVFTHAGQALYMSYIPNPESLHESPIMSRKTDNEQLN
jgi:hypothetical protein